MDFALLGIPEKLEYALVFKTDFRVSQKVEGHFVLLLAIESVDILLERIKKKVGEIK